MKCRKFLSVIFFSAILSVLLAVQVFAQDRQRVVNNERPIQKTEVISVAQPVSRTPNPISRPTLTNQIRIVSANNSPSLIKKTASSTPVNLPANNAIANQSLAGFNRRLLGAMQSKLGIPYRYGSEGPNSYDCSALVSTVFQNAGLPFTRTSARNYYNTFEPVYGDDRFKFGTLVFFNGLGHVGIVVDENTFYHASSSKGVTFSPFAGYWSKRIVGFRRIPMNF